MNYSAWKQQLSKPEVVAILNEGTICTPFPLIEEIVDKLPVKWDNPNVTFLDPCCGRGAFLFVIKNRLLKYHTEQHIVENMLYGVDISEQNVAFTKAVLDPENKYNANIERNDSLTKDWNMKFDVVIGNPPYQDLTNKSKAVQSRFWIEFLKLGVTTLTKANGFVSLVTPSTWAQNACWKKYFIPNQIIHLNVNECARHFPGVGSSFSYFVLQMRPHTDPFTVTLDEGTRTYQTPPIHGIVPAAADAALVEKCLTHTPNRIGAWRTCNPHFAFRENSTKVANDPDTRHCYPFLNKEKANGDELLWADEHDPRQQGVARVVMSSWRTLYKSMRVTSDLLVGENHIQVSCSSLEEAKRLRDVLTSRLFVKLLNVIDPASKSFTTTSISKLPAVPLDRDWTDEELYEHFNLTQDEIDLIESTVK